MQTISRVGGIITKAAACQAARQEFARQFQTMAASMGYWHLYACVRAWVRGWVEAW